MRAVLDWLVAWLFRWLPRSAPTGLFAIGQPDPHSPVIATGNFSLTLARVRKALRGRDCWLLVAHSGGINVWCAADGGLFTHNHVIDAIKVSVVDCPPTVNPVSSRSTTSANATATTSSEVVAVIDT